jgi:hypothetical protein
MATRIFGTLGRDKPGKFSGESFYSGGSWRITGTVTRLGVPGAYRLQLRRMKPINILLDEIWSNPDGTYEFKKLEYIQYGYWITAFDHLTPNKGLQVASYITLNCRHRDVLCRIQIQL